PLGVFANYADYKFTSRRVKRRTPNKQIDKDLQDLRDGSLAEGTNVTFRTHRDMDETLKRARGENVPVSTYFSSSFVCGGEYKVDVKFRDPWQIIRAWVTDETLMDVSTWYSQRRYLCTSGQIDYSNPLIEEPYTGETWWKVDELLPNDRMYLPCFLGLHVRLDKGLVTTKVKMHPILFRACWIHSATRNGSGNGGSALAGFVKMPEFLRQIDPKTLATTARAEYDFLKRMIYRGVCGLVMSSLKARSHNGEAMRFADNIIRRGFPGVLIESMDFEELAAWLGHRNSMALHPCPQCLVHKDDLPKLTQEFCVRTVDLMHHALANAPNGSKAEREQYLRSFGLHDFENFLWNFAHSDPYKAASYDCLHFFDGGIWDRHVWVVIKTYLQLSGLASEFNKNMGLFPRWRDLSHLPSPTTIDYSDGQTFLDILKVVFPHVFMGTW
ncbi:hypothetical protein C8F01DRAFT_987688, partial [Mycena amicta]